MTYFELNENMSGEERTQIAGKLTSSGAFPPANVKILQWIATPDAWGVLISEAESAADVFAAVGLWRAAGAGFFKKTRTAPALPVQEAIALSAELTEAVK